MESFHFVERRHDRREQKCFFFLKNAVPLTFGIGQNVQSVETLGIGLGWDLSGDFPENEEAEALKKGNKGDRVDEEDAVKMVEDQNKKNRAKKDKADAFELDIDIDGSVLVFGRREIADNEQGTH